MQVGSLGATGLQAARHALSRGHPVRHYHIPARQTRLGTGRQFLQQSRHYLARFFSHLTAPGIGHQAYPSYTHVVRSSVGHHSALPVRTLARQSFLPRAPAIPRSVTQVGLGTARQFSSARPVFQSLLQNTPVAARAFCEADIDIKSGKKGSVKASRNKRSSKGRKVSYKVKDVEAPVLLSKSALSEMDLYFHAPVAEVTTSLHIPLAPTPTERTPLRDLPPRRDGSFIPVATVLSIHTTHEAHTTRVATLFSRLDAANVWDKGVTCSAYSHLSNGQGVATILKVEFVGWTQAQVRAVIGESGTGWCALEETFSMPMRDRDSVLGSAHGYDSDASETSSILSGLVGEEICLSDMDSAPPTPPEAVDPSNSCVLPTLDFSSSFVNNVQGVPSFSRPGSVLSDFEYMSDSSDGSFVEIRPSMEFSAHFLSQRQPSLEDSGPMEAMF